MLAHFGSNFLVANIFDHFFDLLTQPLLQQAYVLYSYRGIVYSVVACSPLNAKALHATLKSLVLRTCSRYISLLDLNFGRSFELKCTVAANIRVDRGAGFLFEGAGELHSFFGHRCVGRLSQLAHPKQLSSCYLQGHCQGQNKRERWVTRLASTIEDC